MSSPKFRLNQLLKNKAFMSDTAVYLSHHQKFKSLQVSHYVDSPWEYFIQLWKNSHLLFLPTPSPETARNS